MNNVYISTNELTEWIIDKYFRNKDLVSIDDLIGLIEDLDSEVEKLNEEIDSLTYVNDYPNEERDREIEVLGDE